ncbi:hypothetical protein [Spirosoma spitsbergense]|uniref:hypothetical protein n=1 Tax=Spirosoma spitsbergense TaxID=431554 RepID=UPI00035F9475|nr:hypothetical protein [Spirosoma spitsbergense]
MNIQQAINQIENYTLKVQAAKEAGTHLMAGLDGFMDELRQGETFTTNDLLALWEQYKINNYQEALTRAFSSIKD